MKSLIRSFLYNLFALYAVTIIVPGFDIRGGYSFFALAAFVFVILNFFLKPLLKILFFPINFVTLGLFAWVVNVLILYVLMYFVKQIVVGEWNFSGFSYAGFTAPAIHFTKFLTVVLTSFVISLTLTVLNWIRK